MAVAEIHKNSIGVTFKITIKEGDSAYDVSSASTKQLVFKKPSGELLTVDCTFTNSGSDGKIQYSTVSGDLDEVGWWRLQAYLVIGSNEFRTNIGRFQVHDNL